MKTFFYTYVLLSERDGKFYTGYTNDIEKRFEEHQNGEVSSTKYRRPLILVYYEVCLNQMDAIRREKYLKTTYGKRYLRNRMREFFKEHEL